ncbi:type IX secretion system membrane protein PorP/SprF [Maribrevibacterium harenarium]|uniref:Type IX secretion system membrane protein PorP/SprF n=1 Tax=Maribrevibacterium harenarium TaxID=2589817 RepID=A0A501WPQ6_9GAMM|nr:conjugal transfer protein TraF [Maribrevibacterium harenarium]TPE50305.1 type IX secretion system membrane protein PorP/SprF [Maribrevibacterium harenarium]
MKKLLLVAGSIACGASYAASPVFQPIGSSFTLGTSANVRALSTSLNNPAAPFLMVNTEEGDRFRFGIFGPGGFGYEFGQVDSLVDKIDQLNDKIDNELDNVNDPSGADALKDELNDIIASLGENANGKLMTSGQLPMMPLIFKHPTYGAFTLDASLSALGQGRFLDDDVDLVLANGEYKVDTNSAVYVKNGMDLSFGFGYSKDVWANSYGMLIAGAKVNVHAITLGKALFAFSGADKDDSDDVFSDALSDNQTTTTSAALDLGAIWTANNYQVGFTAANLNEPEFDYGSLDQTCTGLTGAKYNNCLVTRELAGQGRIALQETHVLERQFTADAAVYLDNRQWTLAGSYDFMAVSDFVGDQYQWAVASASYYGENAWIPGFRVGYRKNLAGSELSYLTMGATLFKRLNLDMAYGLESVDIDGSSAPRSLFLSAGIESAF